MQWKVQVESDEATLAQLTQAYNTPAAQITKDGVDWFLESTDFSYFTDHLEVKQKASEIVSGMLASGKIPPQTEIQLGAIYRIHYDNSKSVFR